MRKVDIAQSVWILQKNILAFPANQLLYDTLQRKGILTFIYDPSQLEKLKRILRKRKNHVIFQNPLGKELNALKEILKRRRNFSVIYADWWTVPPSPLMQYADYLIFHHLNALKAAQKGAKAILLTPRLPLWSRPQNLKLHEVLLAALRLPYLPAIPFVEIGKSWQRKKSNWQKKRLLYFPFAINPAAPEFNTLPADLPQYDFANLGSTSFFCRAKSAYVPAALSFINLYADRLKMVQSISQTKHFRLFDCRKTPVYGPKTLQIIKRSKYVLATGGYHQASILKYLEIIACGTPILGAKIPHEFPCLNQAIFPLDVLRSSIKQMQKKLQEAMDQYPVFKKEALKARARIFEFYNQETILALLQKQYNGEKISHIYIAQCSKK